MHSIWLFFIWLILKFPWLCHFFFFFKAGYMCYRISLHVIHTWMGDSYWGAWLNNKNLLVRKVGHFEKKIEVWLQQQSFLSISVILRFSIWPHNFLSKVGSLIVYNMGPKMLAIKWIVSGIFQNTKWLQ